MHGLVYQHIALHVLCRSISLSLETNDFILQFIFWQFVHHYLEIELEGTRSNRNGLGARVAAHVGTRTIRAAHQSGFGFGTSNGPALHLGLGSATHIDSLDLHWPSGTHQRFFDLPADCSIHIVEPSTAKGLTGATDPAYKISWRQP